MKLVDLFTAFLKHTVNLNETRVGALETSVDALTKFVRESDWHPRVRGFEGQGSWKHETIIRPVDGDEFDADLLILVEPVDGWSAAAYLDKLGEVFGASGLYKDKARLWDYCVTITYAGDKRVDLAPCVVGRCWPGSLEVCNRARNAFERSEPIAYTAWLKERNTYSGSNSFRKVTRLLKYLRDIKTTFTCPSVLLTTLLGMQIHWWDKDTDDFADVPTTLRTVMRRLDDWLQVRLFKPKVLNPKLDDEDLAASLTEAQYTNFRNFIHKYRGWIDEAYDTEGRTESIKAWQRVFGGEFAKGEAVTFTKSLVEDRESLRSALLVSAAGTSVGDCMYWVDRIRQFGISILPVIFNRQPHMKLPPWTSAPTVSEQVHVLASWCSSRHAGDNRAIRAGEVLRPRGGLWFDVRVNGGEILPAGFNVHWRITNTGVIAKARGAERGDFYLPQVGHCRWEGLEYRGVHIAEAFIVDATTRLLVGHSAPFNVVIE